MAIAARWSNVLLLFALIVSVTLAQWPAPYLLPRQYGFEAGTTGMSTTNKAFPRNTDSTSSGQSPSASPMQTTTSPGMTSTSSSMPDTTRDGEGTTSDNNNPTQPTGNPKTRSPGTTTAPNTAHTTSSSSSSSSSSTSSSTSNGGQDRPTSHSSPSHSAASDRSAGFSKPVTTTDSHGHTTTSHSFYSKTTKALLGTFTRPHVTRVTSTAANGDVTTKMVTKTGAYTSTTGHVTATNPSQLHPNADGSSGSLSSSSKKIIGGVVGGIGGAILIGVIAIVFYRRWRKKKQQQLDDYDDIVSAGYGAYSPRGHVTHEDKTTSLGSNPAADSDPMDRYTRPGDEVPSPPSSNQAVMSEPVDRYNHPNAPVTPSSNF